MGIKIKKVPFAKQRALFLARPRGVEPLSQEPESCVLSIILWAEKAYIIIVLFCSKVKGDLFRFAGFFGRGVKYRIERLSEYVTLNNQKQS